MSISLDWLWSVGIRQARTAVCEWCNNHRYSPTNGVIPFAPGEVEFGELMIHEGDKDYAHFLMYCRGDSYAVCVCPRHNAYVGMSFNQPHFHSLNPDAILVSAEQPMVIKWEHVYVDEPCDCGCHIPGLLPVPDCCDCGYQGTKR